MRDITESSPSLAGLDLNLLVALHALLETGSVTAAARRLGRTQSATSHALKRLRESLHDPLFVRDGRGLVPTPRALALAEPVSEAVSAVQRVFDPPEAFDPAHTTRAFCLGVPDLAAPLVPGLLSRLGARAPGLSLRVVAPGPGWIEALGSGALDLALGSVFDGQGSRLRQQVLGTVRFSVLGRRGHPAFADGVLDLQAWTAWPHVLVNTGNETPNRLQEHLDALGVQRRVGLVVPGFLMALHVVARTELLFAAPHALVTELSSPLGLEVHALPLDLPALPVAQHWHERAQGDPGHAWLRGQVREEVAAQLSRGAQG